MSGWSTFLLILAFIVDVGAVLFLVSDPVYSIFLFVGSLPLYMMRSLFRCIDGLTVAADEIRAKQKKILNNQIVLARMIREGAGATNAATETLSDSTENVK